MRRAVIDLGTNTFNLLIADVEAHKINFVYKAKMSAKLGENGINESLISRNAINRAVSIIKEYHKIIQKHRVHSVNAIATSAVRSAHNGLEFKQILKDKTGIEIEIISGEKEAQLIYNGVKESLPSNLSSYLILDIGGGSTEFILVKNGLPEVLKSFNLGMARLLERFTPSDPILPSEVEQVRAYVKEKLAAFFRLIRSYDIDTLVGSSGSFDTILAMIAHRFFEAKFFKKNSSSIIELSHFDSVFEQTVWASHAERQAIPGMDLIRVEMMPLALIFVQVVVEELNIKNIFQSKYALKEGLLFGK